MTDADTIREFIDTRDPDPEVFAALYRLVAERDELERLRKPLIVALAQAEAEVARLREYADRMVVQVDELTEGRIERNAEVARLREALARVDKAALAGKIECEGVTTDSHPAALANIAAHHFVAILAIAALGEDA